MLSGTTLSVFLVFFLCCAQGRSWEHVDVWKKRVEGSAGAYQVKADVSPADDAKRLGWIAEAIEYHCVSPPWKRLSDEGDMDYVQRMQSYAVDAAIDFGVLGYLNAAEDWVPPTTYDGASERLTDLIERYGDEPGRLVAALRKEVPRFDDFIYGRLCDSDHVLPDLDAILSVYSYRR